MDFGFPDDDEDSYVVNEDFPSNQEDLDELPLSLAALSVGELQLKHSPNEEYQAILQLSDPLQLFFLQSLLHVVLEETFVLQIEELPDEENRPVDPVVDIKVNPDTFLDQVFQHKYTDLVLGKILPLFGISVFKSPRKAGYTHYAFRHQGKMMRASALCRVIHDLSLIFNLPKAITMEEILQRWLLAMASAFLHSYPLLCPTLWGTISTYSIDCVAPSPDAPVHDLEHKPRSLQALVDLYTAGLTVVTSPTQHSAESSPVNQPPLGLIQIDPEKHSVRIQSIPPYSHGETLFLAPLLALTIIQQIVQSSTHVTQQTIEFSSHLVELLQFMSQVVLDTSQQDELLSEAFFTSMSLTPSADDKDASETHEDEDVNLNEEELESLQTITNDEQTAIADGVATTLSFALVKQLFTSPFALLLCHWGAEHGYVMHESTHEPTKDGS